ncbi:MAG TPA: hypothetical protein DCM11_02580 [Lachnospiraceae bacterium]|nr:hypothetical protein [Lachnospiraceae bacterium]
MIFGTLLLMENAKNKRLPNPRKPLIYWLFRRATDGARTRDLHLGKVYMRLEGTGTPDKYGICITNLRIFM